MTLCLARDGVAQEVSIQETAEKLLVTWESRFQISGAAFTVVAESGQTRTIMGYPTSVILQVAQRMRAHGMRELNRSGDQ